MSVYSRLVKARSRLGKVFKPKTFAITLSENASGSLEVEMNDEVQIGEISILPRLDSAYYRHDQYISSRTGLCAGWDTFKPAFTATI
jgi:hypothetical protein